MSPELQKFLTDFLFAIVTGVVAGVVAGWVIWRFQLNAQLALDDTPKIISMVQSLQAAHTEITMAMMMQEFVTESEEGTKEEGELTDVDTKVAEAGLLILKLASQAQYIRAKRYRELRAYLNLRIKRSTAWHEDVPDIMLKKLDDLMKDIGEFVYSTGAMFRIKKIWKHLRHPVNYFRNRLKSEEKELLTIAIRKDAYLSLIDETSTPYVFVLTGKSFLGEDASKYVAALNRLSASGLIEPSGDKTFELSREGWKTAIHITKGKAETGLLT